MAYLIGEAVKMLSLSADTLRYYEKIGLVPRIAKNGSGQRVYSNKDLALLRFVQRAQGVGFSLDEIGRLLRFRQNPVNCSQAVRELARQKCTQIQEQIGNLQKMHAELALLLNICSGDSQHCQILDTLDKP